MLTIISTQFELLLLTFSVIAAIPVPITHNDNLNAEVVFQKGSTEITVVRYKYMWTIKNFNPADYINGQRVNSPTFITHDDCQWYLFMYPKGYNKESEEYVSLFLFSVSCNTTANVGFGILNANNETINSKTLQHRFLLNHNFGYHKFIRQDFLLNRENAVLVNNTLTIISQINVTISKTNGKLKQPEPNNDLGNDFKFLLDNEEFSDVKLSVGGKEFSALKAILAARSPVFKSMFKSTPNVSRVDIDDVETDVVIEMLRYIYTGEVSNLENFASNLLIMAERYELVSLKTICENFMSANLTIENAADFYIFGDTYFAGNLKSQAKDFIISHGSSVIVTPGFKSLIQTHPLLVEEIFSAIIKQNSNAT